MRTAITFLAVVLLILVMSTEYFERANEADPAVPSPKALTAQSPDNAIMANYIRSINKRLSEDEALLLVETVLRVAHHSHLDPMLVFGLIQTESTFKPTAKSSYGAKGFMQVVPRWHPEKLEGRNLFALEDSIEVGATVLQDCMQKANFNLTRALSCYSGYSVDTVGVYKAKVWKYRNAILKELQ